MAKKVKHYEAKCPRCALMTKREDCPNCNKKTIVGVVDISTKTTKVQCSCGHEFTGTIDCVHCKCKIYWKDVKFELGPDDPETNGWDIFFLILILIWLLYMFVLGVKVPC